MPARQKSSAAANGNWYYRGRTMHDINTQPLRLIQLRNTLDLRLTIDIMWAIPHLVYGPKNTLPNLLAMIDKPELRHSRITLRTERPG